MQKEEKSRQCISCRVQKSRHELIRITKVHDSKDIVVNPSNYELGRSAYICKNLECVKKAVKEKKIGKMLRASSSQLSNLSEQFVKGVLA